VSGEKSFEELVELAVGRGLRFLGFRGRTELETRNRLIQRGFAEDVVDSAVARLMEMGYLNDAEFCVNFTDDRRRLDSWGNGRIRRRLRDLGAPAHLVDAALESDHAAGELQRAIELLDRRLDGPADAAKERQKAMGLLIRRGYSSEVASNAIRAHSRAAHSN